MGKVRIFTEEEIQNVRDLAANGRTLCQVSNETGISFYTLKKLAAKEGIEFQDGMHMSTTTKYTIDANHFDVIDTPNKAYFLGFMFADAAVDKSLHRMQLNLQEQDRCLLEALKEEFEMNAPIKERTVYKKTLHGKEYHGVYKNVQLRLDNTHLVTRSAELGMTPAKSLVIKFPTEVPDNLMIDFIRGYYDGNGHLIHSFSTKYTNRLGITTGSSVFIEQLQNYCKNELGIEGRIKTPDEKKCFLWEITSIQKILDFCEAIYHKDCGYYLPRKYEKYIEFCKYASAVNIPNRPIVNLDRLA